MRITHVGVRSWVTSRHVPLGPIPSNHAPHSTLPDVRRVSLHALGIVASWYWYPLVP